MSTLPESDAPGFVYIVQGESDAEDWTAPVKIGYAKDVRQRARSLQTGNPDRLRLLVCFPGTMVDEKSLHARFDAARLRDEWFRYSEELESFVLETRVALLTGALAAPVDMPLWFAPGFHETFEPEDTCSCGYCVEDAEDEVNP